MTMTHFILHGSGKISSLIIVTIYFTYFNIYFIMLSIKKKKKKKIVGDEEEYDITMYILSYPCIKKLNRKCTSIASSIDGLNRNND